MRARAAAVSAVCVSAAVTASPKTEGVDIAKLSLRDKNSRAPLPPLTIRPPGSASDKARRDKAQREADARGEACQVLILDRADDALTPLVHEYSYQALVQDVLPVEGAARDRVRVVDLFRDWDLNGDGKVSKREVGRGRHVRGRASRR